jgi:hypothetical protein
VQTLNGFPNINKVAMYASSFYDGSLIVGD